MQHFNKIVNYIYQQYYESMAVKRLLNIERNSHGPTSDANETVSVAGTDA